MLDMFLRDSSGGSVSLMQAVGQRPAVIVFASRQGLEPGPRPLEQLSHVEKHLKNLGYQIVFVIASPASESSSVNLRLRRGNTFLFDEGRVGFARMGLLSATADGARVVESAFVVGKDGRILYQYSNVGGVVPLSGEVLLTAARVYRDLVVRGAAEG